MTEQQQYPTREQIAAAIDGAPHGETCNFGARLSVQLSRECTCWKVDLLALFPQPTPSAESSVQVPEATLRLIDRKLGEDAWHPEDCPGSHPAYCTCAVGEARRALRDLLAHPAASAEPPSIADMAPGTTFRMRRNNDSAWHLWCWTGRALMRIGARVTVQGAIGQMNIDPSTIRDVTPPHATHQDG